MGQLNLRVLIEAVDRATKPLRGIQRGISGLVRPAKIAGLAALSLGRDLRNMALMGAAAVTALGLAVLRMVQGTTNAGAAVLLASQKTGVAVVSYQRLKVAAEQAGVGADKLDTSLGAVNRRIDAARLGVKGAVDPFARLGVRLRDVNGEAKTTEQLILEVADRFEALPDGARKSAIAAALFGEAGTELIPMLNQGADALRQLGDDAEAAGAVLSEQAARDALTLQQGMKTLKRDIGGLSNQIVVGLLPDLIKLVGWLREMLAAHRPEIVRQLKAAFAQVTAVLPDLIEGLKGVFGFLGDIARVLGPVVKAVGGFAGVLDILAGLMIGRVALAIWVATKAVMGLNVAMYANPIGLIIAGIAALVLAGWLLYRNWDKVVAALKRAWGGFVRFFQGLGAKMKAAFKVAIDALWRMLPPWLRTLFRVGVYTVKVIGQGLGGTPAPSATRPHIGTGTNRTPNGSVDININQNGRLESATVRGDGVALKRMSGSRGGYGGS